MRFSSSIFLASLAAMASANTVEFVSKDSTARTIYFTQQIGLPTIDPVSLPGMSNVTVEFSTGWIGNFFSISEGLPVIPGMLGEIRWDGWEGNNFFDISAIVNKDDTNGIKTLTPKWTTEPTAGCNSYETVCPHAYYLPDDLQTHSTTDKDLICTVGGSTSQKKARRHPRHFVTGHSLY